MTSEDNPADATRVSNWTLATETKPGARAVYSARRVGQVQAGRNIEQPRNAKPPGHVAQTHGRLRARVGDRF